ncbi:MAG TPA: MYXO-CTERM sorting domain-containing protein [Lapillicoccus sp.]|nr:MYXO-CTERM sorting domain-containing protein [Lapillicoccus sp.]
MDEGWALGLGWTIFALLLLWLAYVLLRRRR